MTKLEPRSARRPRHPWLRRNFAGLVCLAVLVPATAASVFLGPWTSRESRSVEVVRAPDGNAAEFSGARFEVTAAAEFTGTGADGNLTPRGSSIIAAIVEVTPDDRGEGPSCDFSLTLPRSAGITEGREWAPLSSPSRYNYVVGDESETFCSSDLTEPYELELAFLVPDDLWERDDLRLELSVAVFSDEVMQFDLPR